jgi:GxxExxY protein
MTRDELDRCTGTVIDSGIVVHRELGPGLLERAYLVCLEQELRSRDLTVRSSVEMPLIFRGVRLDVAYRIDLLVEEEVILELKAVAKLLPIHEAQLLSYLRLSKRRVGLLINFHVPLLKDGIKRLVNNF